MTKVWSFFTNWVCKFNIKVCFIIAVKHRIFKRKPRSFSGKDICIIEKLQRVGKKILSTGNGQCNLTNENFNLSNYHGTDANFSKYALETYGKQSLIDFFEGLGVKVINDNGL